MEVLLESPNLALRNFETKILLKVNYPSFSRLQMIISTASGLKDNELSLLCSS